MSLGILAFLLACKNAPVATPGRLVLLVSFDTTRADAVSAYGRVANTTPHVDALAAEGVRFGWALAQAPTTLCSHATVFTGLDTHGTGVAANGYALRPDLPVLAERFRDAGWDTLAVVASSALERPMGLDRGFRFYDDQMSVHSGPRYEDPAAHVTTRALDAVDHRRAGDPLFLFVHYFDPHGPWNSASSEIRSRFVDPAYQGRVNGERDGADYLIQAMREKRASPADVRQGKALYHAEVASADDAFGALLSGLAQRTLLNDALVVVFGDHGETLDEQPDRSFGHGYDADLYAIHVPLVIHGTGGFQVPTAVIDSPVRLQDLGATVLSLASVPGALGSGRDLAPLWKGGTLADVPIFSEATKPFRQTHDTGWNNLRTERAVASGGFFLTRAPWLNERGSLFTLDWDQKRVDDPATAARLGALLDAWDAAAPAPREDRMRPETVSALKSLGYVE